MAQVDTIRTAMILLARCIIRETADDDNVTTELLAAMEYWASRYPEKLDAEAS